MSDKPIVYIDDSDTTVYRASAIGGCTKSLIAVRMGFESVPPPAWLRPALEEGQEREEEVLEKALEQVEPGGWVEPDQRPVELVVKGGEEDGDRVVIRGHTDGTIYRDDGLDSPAIAGIEAKAFGETLWNTYKKKGMAAFPYYIAQLTIYMQATGLPFYFAVLNKVTGEVDVQRYDSPPMDVELLVQKVLYVEEKAWKSDLPVECDMRSAICPVPYLHEDTEAQPIEGFLAGEEVDTFLALTKTYEKAQAEEKAAREKKKKAGAGLKPLFETAGEKKLEDEVYTVTWVANTYTKWDEEAMRKDGIDPEKYKVKMEGNGYPKVTNKVKKAEEKMRKMEEG